MVELKVESWLGPRLFRLFRTAIVWLRWRSALTAFWLLLEWQFGKQYWVSGTVVAVFAATLAETLEKKQLSPFRAPRGWIGAALRIPGALVADTVRVFTTLAAPVAPAGRILRVAFEPGDRDDRWDDARVALVIASASLTPNTIVLGVDREGRELIVHQLRDAPFPQAGRDERWPV